MLPYKNQPTRFLKPNCVQALRLPRCLAGTLQPGKAGFPDKQWDWGRCLNSGASPIGIRAWCVSAKEVNSFNYNDRRERSEGENPMPHSWIYVCKDVYQPHTCTKNWKCGHCIFIFQRHYHISIQLRQHVTQASPAVIGGCGLRVVFCFYGAGVDLRSGSGWLYLGYQHLG